MAVILVWGTCDSHYYVMCHAYTSMRQSLSTFVCSVSRKKNNDDNSVRSSKKIRTEGHDELSVEPKAVSEGLLQISALECVLAIQGIVV